MRHIVGTTIPAKVITKCIIFFGIISRIIIPKYTLEGTQFNVHFKNFHNLTHHTTTQAGCITIPPHYLKNYTPMFEHGYFALDNNDHSFGPPTPPPTTDNDIASEYSAMQAFPTTALSKTSVQIASPHLWCQWVLVRQRL